MGGRESCNGNPAALPLCLRGTRCASSRPPVVSSVGGAGNQKWHLNLPEARSGSARGHTASEQPHFTVLVSCGMGPGGRCAFLVPALEPAEHLGLEKHDGPCSVGCACDRVTLADLAARKSSIGKRRRRSCVSDRLPPSPTAAARDDEACGLFDRLPDSVLMLILSALEVCCCCSTLSSGQPLTQDQTKWELQKTPWHHQATPLSDGPMGASLSGTVSGMHGVLLWPLRKAPRRFIWTIADRSAICIFASHLAAGVG